MTTLLLPLSSSSPSSAACRLLLALAVVLLALGGVARAAPASSSDAASPLAAADRPKRAPFSSWAGKRSSPSSEVTLPRADLAQLLHDLQELYLLQMEQQQDKAAEEEEEAEQQLHLRPVGFAKRAPFSSWAGKRAAFSSWAGKRAPFSSWAGKRAPFSSWAGKRSSSSSEPETAVEPSQHRFKRSSGEDDTLMLRNARSFSTWGGKRSQLRRIARNAPEGNGMPVRVMRPHRAAFSAWGG